VDDIGRRLENFFWRIWSNERLRQRLSGTQVNILFEIINEGGFIRTTPQSSPRSSKSLSAYYKQARLRTSPTTSPTTEVSNESTLSTAAEPSSSKESSSDSAVPLAIARSFAQFGRLNHPGPPSSHGDIADSSFTPTPTSPLAAIEKSTSATGRSPSHKGSEDSSVTPTCTSPLAALEKSSGSSKENRRTSLSNTRRLPILKKGSSGSSRSSQSAKIAGPSSGEPQYGPSTESEEAVSIDDDSNSPTGTKSSYARRPAATRFNEEVAVSIPKPSTSAPRSAGERMARSSTESSQRPGKRNPVVVASTGSSKTRPTFARQRSSTGASKEVPSRSSSSLNLARTPKPPSAARSTEFQFGQNSKPSPEPPSTRRSRAVSPHPSKQRRRISPDLPASPSSEELLGESDLEDPEATVESKSSKDLIEGSASSKPEPSKPLVDLGFRAKFIDRTRASQRSLTDLSTFSRKSSASVPTAASFQASGMMESSQATSSAGRGKGREAFMNVTAPLKGPGPAGPEVAGEQDPQPLPRTKSQLTLLLEKEKARSANEERKARRTEP